MTTSVFLTANWNYLAMINYEIDPEVLQPFVPPGTQLDLWQGRALISLVGFLFQKARVWGCSIPFHTHFEEINLRYYIKRVGVPEGERRGVAFIKEIVPKRAVAQLARMVYNENYVAHPMRHSIEQDATQITAEYQWFAHGQWQKFKVHCPGQSQLPACDSEADFITEHYWGYSVLRNGKTLQYQVKHPPWRIWEADKWEVSIDTKSFYGEQFAPYLERPPVSAFLAEGSEVTVFTGSRIPSALCKV